jgi:4-aminobutyrate aminotransferase-like enzyme/Ser/Thr protein kinase RdoA (MazF antagonist)
MNYNKLKISAQQAEKITFELFNIKGKAIPLPGYVDFNFRIKVIDEDGYVLKISRPDEDGSYLEFQQELLQYVAQNGGDLLAPKVILAKNGKLVPEITDTFGNLRKVRLLTWIPGRTSDSVNPQLDTLRYSWGKHFGQLTSILQGFDHPEAYRYFDWDLAQSLWTKEHIDLFDKKEKKVVSYFQKRFEQQQSGYKKLRKSIVHNDANNNNVVVSDALIDPVVKAAIDYGDVIYTQTINDVAIACAYSIMGQNDPLAAALPLIKGYHSAKALQEIELEHLYIATAMRLILTVTHAAINKRKEPDNEYLLICEKPGWEILYKWYDIDEDFAHFSFRKICGYTAHPNESVFNKWALDQPCSLRGLFPTIDKNSMHHLDLSVSSSWIGHETDFTDLEFFQFKINKLQGTYPSKIITGGYLEPRAVYTSPAYEKTGNFGKETRTIHLGIDCWLPPGTPVHALFDGEVVTAVNDVGDKEYGGLIILKHKTKDFDFFTLYGHLSVDSVLDKNIGEKIKKGDCIGRLGIYQENGNWVPHLHFQIMLSMMNYRSDYPGVAYFSQIDVLKSICPDPNLLFKLKELQPYKDISNEELIAYRKKHLGKSLSLQYKIPIRMVRGTGQYLMDQFGRKYLDTINNVAHVGHEHPAVVKAGQQQMALLNTNSRYLHGNINELAKELMQTLPPELNVLHFVNSGSEANELAIRMVKAATGAADIIASEAGYHGNTNSCIAISSYKFDGKGGRGTPEHTHIIPLPDSFRGKYRGKNTGKNYAKEVQLQIKNIQERGRKVGAFIIEPIISCGGQIELPQGFLSKAYEYVRTAGGLCISDEVQVGCGRVGKFFWGFQLHEVIPDIVTIGKPLGNGHPLAAVACTQEVAEKFANGMEYFNTFGGNPVSCAIGTEVLRTIKREKLQENAFNLGKFLKQELKKLASEFPIIGDVRGQGLFLGIELVDIHLNPLPQQTTYLVNRMKDFGILMSTDGLDYNVIKIKPPMVFTKENAQELIYYLRKILKEDFMQKKAYYIGKKPF